MHNKGISHLFLLLAGCIRGGDDDSLREGDKFWFGELDINFVGDGVSSGGVLGWSGGVAGGGGSAGRDSGSLSGDTVGSNGSYLSGSGGVIGPLLGVWWAIGLHGAVFSFSLSLTMSTSSFSSSITL